MNKKYWLVKYTVITGEYEFSGQVVLSRSARAKIENAVHYYFKHYYDEPSNCDRDSERLEHYLYNGGEVAVKRISWREITQEQAQVLADLNIA